MNKTRPVSPAVVTSEELDQRTLSLIRRTLCSHHPPTVPLNELLPALTSSTKVDVHLYAIIAVIVRDFVLSWYTTFSTDHAFVEEITAVIAHCTRALEERLRKVDLEVLLLDEIPALFQAHVSDYRSALHRHDTALAAHKSVVEAFRGFQTHPVSDDQRNYLKLLSIGILAVLLPTEDLESPCERSFVTETLADAVFGNIVDKLSEPFMIYELVTNLLRPNIVEPAPSSVPRSLLDRTFTILTRTWNSITLLVTSVHGILLESLPPQPANKRPLIRSVLLSALSTFLNIRRYQPWLPSTLRLLSKPFSSRSNTLGWILDDLLLQNFTPYLCSADTTIWILKLVRRNLFLNDALAPPGKYPSEKQKIEIRAEAERVLHARLGNWARTEWLDVFEEKEVNKVLIARLMDLVVARLLPELEEMGGAEVLEDRIGIVGV